MNTMHDKNGFTLIEMLLSIGIIGLMVVTTTTFQRDIFYLNNTIQSSLNAQLDARHVVKVMVAELRKASQSAVGSYSIALASSTGVTFYSDVNSDGLQDQVRYFLSGTTIQKGVTAPTGSPLTYTVANEKITTLINSVLASSTVPLFQYFPASYSGTSSPLSFPIDIPSIRLIKITVMIDNDPAHSPAPITATSQVTLRNLKDNL